MKYFVKNVLFIEEFKLTIVNFYGRLKVKLWGGSGIFWGVLGLNLRPIHSRRSASGARKERERRNQKLTKF